ncbi:hypothetical protein STPH1_7222 [Streptomyces sp. OM5714]|nr:hypothetical protein STPH1_7222 [Streptomyces sp. OM5714]
MEHHHTLGIHQGHLHTQHAGRHRHQRLHQFTGDAIGQRRVTHEQAEMLNSSQRHLAGRQHATQQISLNPLGVGELDTGPLQHSQRHTTRRIKRRQRPTRQILLADRLFQPATERIEVLDAGIRRGLAHAVTRGSQKAAEDRPATALVGNRNQGVRDAVEHGSLRARTPVLTT